MKKYLIALLIIFAIQGSCAAYDDLRNDSMYSVLDIENDNYFHPNVSNSLADPEVNDVSGKDITNYNAGFENTGRRFRALDDDEMPLFKRCRLIITHKLRQLIPAEKPQYTKPIEESYLDEDEKDYYDYLDDDDEKEKKPLSSRLKFWNRKPKNVTPTSAEAQLPSEDSSIVESIKSQIDESTPSDDTLSLETGISEHVTEKEMMLDAPNINYDEETQDMIATGRPVLYFPPQKVKVIADKMVYNQDSNIMKAIGHVIVYKDGLPTRSDYAEIDMNEEMMYMDNVEAMTKMMEVDAEKAIQQNDTLILLNGNFHSDESHVYKMSSRMVGPRFKNMVVYDDIEDLGLFFGDPEGNKIRMDIDKIYVDAQKNHDKFTAKNIKVYRKGKYWFTWPSLTVYTDKDRKSFEANYPELGTKRKVGMFIGPGFTFGGPGGSVMKVIPFLNYQHGDFGFGGELKYRNRFNRTELGYGSAADIFFLRGIQRLDDNLFLHYAANNFTDEWFVGHRMAKYMAELYYDKDYYIPNFLGENRGLSFRHRAGFGLMEDNDRNYYGEKFKSNGTTTTRTRYMAQISQTLYSYQNTEKNFYFSLNWLLQGSAAVYGTGDTQFIARTGPAIHTQYKRWMQDLAYYQTGYDDHTPMPRYDAYRYGHSAVRIAEIFRICKYLSVGWSGMVNLSDDAPNGKLFQENRFVLAIGPDDLKIRLGYDFVRRTTYFGFDVAFDTKGTHINYNRMEIKNPERLGKKDKPERKLAFTPTPQQSEEEERVSMFKKTSQKPKKELKYAQIIEITDPDKETTD
ncbi:hypothetical protein IKR55_02520 [bacterium]|nr:hypothetical protein [bacterium]